MPAGLLLAIALLAPAANAAAVDPATGASVPAANGPAQPVPPKPPIRTAVEPCSPTTRPRPDADEIVVCVERPQGYRLNPDLLEAKRALRRGKPKRPERMVDKSCASVGPAGCGPPAGINLIGAALTAAEMASRLAKGENVGSMFVTDPQPTEYQLYLEAKRRREAKEAEAAIEVKLKAKAAERAARQGETAKAVAETSPVE